MTNTLVSLPAPILLDIAIAATAFAWGAGLYLVARRVYFFESVAIGAVVCLVGYSVAALGCPVWAVIAAPIPLDILVLWYLLRRLRTMAVAYVAIWAIYLVLHMLLSALLHYDSLLPAWKLHS